MQRRSLGLWLVLATGCGSAQSGSDTSDLTSDFAKAGLSEGSDIACAIRRAVSEASADVLDNGVPLDVRAMRGILDARKGADGELGTVDDVWFKDLAALDAVPYVGKKAFKQLAAFAAARPEYACGTVDVQLLAFNDFHGALKPPSGSSGKIVTGPVPATDFKEAGGVEYMATHVAQLRATNPNTLVVAAGDVVGATPLLSSLFHDEPTVESMNLLGLDITAVGNHEFDEGLAELYRMQRGGCHPVDGCQDGDDFAGASYDYLAANVIATETGETILPSTAIRSFRGAHIGFIGLTLEGTALVTSPAGTVGLEFRDEAETINALVPELQAKGVQSIVVLIHEGGAATGIYNGCEGISGPLFEIVNLLDPAIDVVVAGHTNASHICQIDNRIVTSAANYGRLVTDIDLQIDERTGDVVTMRADNVIVTRDVAKDAAQTSLIAKYDALSAPLANRIVASVSGDLVKLGNAAGQAPLGDVVADAQLAATAGSDAVAAFMNPGGIRTDLTVAQISGTEAAGEITYGEAFAVQPFGNTLVTVTVTGAQIETMLEQQWQMASGAEKANMLQVSSGFSYTWDSTRALGDRIDPATIRLNGAVIDPGQTYRITVNAFLAAGGDGFAVLRDSQEPVGGGLDLDAFIAYLEANSPVAPGAEVRITKL